MSPHDGAVHKVLGPVELALHVSKSLQFCPDRLPNAFGRPTTKPAGDGGPFPEAFRDIPPWCACSQDPNNATDDGAMRQIGSPETDQRWKEGFKTFPLFIRDFFTPQ